MPSTYSNCLFHIIFSTKQRLPLIAREFQDELYHYIGGIIHNEGGTLLEIGGVSDHVHLFLKCKPALAISDLIRVVKSNSSKWLNEEKFKLHKFGWQEGFAVFTVSESQAEQLRTYIRNQESHHQKQTYQEELRAFLNKHRIEYDERYFWD